MKLPRNRVWRRVRPFAVPIAFLLVVGATAAALLVGQHNDAVDRVESDRNQCVANLFGRADTIQDALGAARGERASADNWRRAAQIRRAKSPKTYERYSGNAATLESEAIGTELRVESRKLRLLGADLDTLSERMPSGAPTPAAQSEAEAACNRENPMPGLFG